MIKTLYLAVDPDEFTRVLTTQEVSELCVQVSNQIFDLFASHYKTRPIERRLIEKHSTSIQFRIGILGRAAMDKIEKSSIKPHFVKIVTKSMYEFEDDVVNIIKHDMSSTNMKHICPDTLVDFLLMLLEATVKSIQHRLPNTPKADELIKENLSVIRDIFSDLRPLSKIVTLPSRHLDICISSLFVNFDVDRTKPK